MRIWRGAGLKEEEKNPALMAKKDTGHAFYFQVFLGSAIDHSAYPHKHFSRGYGLRVTYPQPMLAWPFYFLDW